MWQQAFVIVQPDTLLRWHRELFHLFWKHKSKVSSHRPKVTAETIDLIREMAKDNRLWGAERMRGELLKLGIRVCKRTIHKYIRSVRTLYPRGQKWSTFLRTHAAQIWACDALSGHRSVLSTALHLFHHQIEVTESDPCRRDAVSHRRLGCTTTAGGDSLRSNSQVPHP